MKFTVKDIEIMNRIFHYKYKTEYRDEYIKNELKVGFREFETYEDQICNYCSFIVSQISDGKRIIVKFNEPQSERFYKKGMFNYLIKESEDIKISLEEELKNKELEREVLLLNKKVSELTIQETERTIKYRKWRILWGFIGFSTGVVLTLIGLYLQWIQIEIPK